MTTDKPDLRYTPFIAHYQDDDGKLVPRHFASNAEAHAFRATLVDGKLPAEPAPAEELPAEPKAAADPVKVDAAKAADQPAPPILTGMVAKETPAPKVDANPPVPAAGRP